MRKISVGSLVIGSEEKAAISAILKSNQISPGPVVRRFEEEFSRFQGAKHGLLVNSGTDALRMALATLKEIHGWKDGDQIAVPAITFVATVNVILQNNLQPYFVDVSMYDFNINPWNLEHCLNVMPKPSRMRAVIPVHLFGKPCDVQNVLKIAKKFNLKVLEDSCETMGMIPIQGDIACYSTYVAHLIATGVGGLAVTNNRHYSEIMRSYANHGRDPYYLPGFRKPRLSKDLIAKRFRFERIGYSSRLTELEAALGLAQLRKLPKMIERRQTIAYRLEKGLAPLDKFILPSLGNHAYMMYPLCIKPRCKINRDKLCLFLEEHGIETRPLMPITNQPCYKPLGIVQSHYPVAQWINQAGFYIACHPGLTDSDVQYMIRIFMKFFRKS